MPELPEVEIVRRGLNEKLLDLTIVDLTVNNRGSFIGPNNLENIKITGTDRRGKCFLILLSNNNYLAVHLKMTGKLIFIDSNNSNYLTDKHTHVVIKFSNNDYLVFNDVRKFGWVRHMTPDEFKELPFIKNLGPEPNKDFDLKYFKKICNKSNSRIISLLLDQSKIAGIGNIYANEALFMSKINPKIKASDLTDKQIKDLFININRVLEKGLRAGGASMRDYVRSDGSRGSFQKEFQVYGSEAKLCRFCGCRIVREKLGSRSIFYCPTCQKF